MGEQGQALRRKPRQLRHQRQIKPVFQHRLGNTLRSQLFSLFKTLLQALLKALLAHLVLDRREWVLVDMEAGVEHLGRGTVAHVDALLVVSEPSMRSLETAAEVARMAGDLGLNRQVLVLNKATPDQTADLPPVADLPQQRVNMPDLEALRARQLHSGSVLGLGDETEQMLDSFCASLLQKIEGESV